MNGMAIRSIALAAGAVLALGACDVARTLGIAREGPDEYTVLRHAPLTVPPEFRLRPPDPDATRPQQLAPRAGARQALLGSGGRAGEASAGEAALVGRTGGDAAGSAIRERIDRESAALAKQNRRLLDDLIFWEDRETASSVVDAAAERKRLEDNAAAGKPPTEGETPTIERR